MNQSKPDVVKLEIARININILGINEPKWMGMGEFNSDDHYIYYWGQKSLRRNGVVLIVNKSPKCSTHRQSQNWQNDLCFQGKSFNITVIQIYAPTTDTKEAEVERFYDDLQDLLELTTTTTTKRCPFHNRKLEYKSRKSRDIQNNSQVWPWSIKWSRANVNRVLFREQTCHRKHPFPTTKEIWTSPNGQ